MGDHRALVFLYSLPSLKLSILTPNFMQVSKENYLFPYSSLRAI